MLAPRNEAARRWTVRLGGVVFAAAMSGLIAVIAVLAVGRSDERVAATYVEDALAAERLRNAVERESASARAFLLTSDRSSLDRSRAARAEFEADLAALRGRLVRPDERALLDAIAARDEAYEGAIRTVLSQRNAGAAAIRDALETAVAPAKSELDGALLALVGKTQQTLAQAREDSADARTSAIAVVSAVAIISVALASVLAVLLRRALRRLAREGDRLATTLEAVEQSNRDLDAFAGRVAHDLRNALSPIVLSATLVRARAPDDPAFVSVCDRLERAIGRATTMVDALLAFARAGRESGGEASASVAGVLDAVMEQLEATIADADLTVERSVAPDLNVRCPAGLLHVVLANVVGNAVKFTRGRPVRRVTITARAAFGAGEIRVDDTGPGIPEAARERIFEPFFRARTKVPGSGIGLATVRRVLQAQGGRVRVESTEGAGSSFVVTMPLADVAVAASDSDEAAAPA